MKQWLVSLIFGVFLLQACSVKPQSQEDCGFVQNVYGERISWKGNLPVPLLIHESVPSDYYQAIESAVQSWEIAFGRPLFKIIGYGARMDNKPKQDGLNVIYWLETWESNKSSEQARTSVYWVSDTIREADIRINAKDFSFYNQAPLHSKDVHFESLVIHELGHVLGLKHKDSDSSVMGTYLASQTSRDSIALTDREALLCEY